ncbi:MAG: homocysteine S-methyltransferase family protein, partial [Bacteroidales bacterium]|nr:homocysteine S-methyltransferase family protein [Bacteroidales bacterium]
MIKLLDGAMGTVLQQRFQGGDAPAGPAETLNLSHPEVIADIHREYIAAGADIIETNTFNANRISLEAHGLADKARELALAGARIARKVAEEPTVELTGRKIRVAGSVGPTSRSLTLPSDISRPQWREVDFDTMAEAYREQIKALIEGGVDLILVETCFDALNAKAALYALQQVAPGFPAMVSVSVADRSGRTLTGQTLEAFYHSVRHYPLSAFGLNCSLGAEEMLPLIREVARFSAVPVLCYPNAGLPDEEGRYVQTPDEMAALLGRMVSEGLVDIVGGCCGSTPSHIRAIANMLKMFEGALPPDNSRGCPRAPDSTVSGLEAHPLRSGGTGFTPVGERTNVAGSRKFARLIASGAYDEALGVAAAQVEAGAGIIDINMDDGMLDAPREMERFVRYISGEPAVASAALMIDSSDWKAVLAGLKNAQGRSIVNSVSLKEGEEALIEKAREIHALGAAMVVMAFDEQGQAVTLDRKIAIASRAYHILTEKAHIPPEDLIFDCNILSIGTGIPEHARYAVDFIEAVRWIKLHLPGALTSGGVSNLSFAFRGNNPVREAMHAVFLYHAVKAGLDMAIVNPSSLIPCEAIGPDLYRAVEDVILDRDPQATERLLAWIEAHQPAPGMPGATGASGASGREVPPQNTAFRAQPHVPEVGSATKHGFSCGTSPISPEANPSVSPEESLSASIVRGRTENLEPLTLACLERLGSAVSVVEGPLMRGMEQVGKMFGEGKMFLPQVVKSARTMREAVAVLEPYFPEEGSAGESSGRNGRIVLATVKGDVHDIGKNITGIVLKCNGFDVTDLGVMVESERILAEAERLDADLIAVSGLITPSLYQMEELCREMARLGMTTPLLIGGATTSAVHTAVKLAPLYGHVYYCADASASAVMAKRLMLDRAGTEASARADQARLRALREASHPQKAPAHPQNEPAHPQNQPKMWTEATKMPAHPQNEPETWTDGCRIEGSWPDGRREIPLEELVPLFDERMYLAIWGIPYGKVNLSDPAIAETLREAHQTLERMVRRHEVRVTLSCRFLRGAHRTEDGLDWIDGYPLAALGCAVSTEESRYAHGAGENEEGSQGRNERPRVCALPMLRDAEGRCLADLLPANGTAERTAEGVFGMFAVAVEPTLRHPVGCD